ncbi:MAG: addiction module protein [Pyrinomonadaceae bacterium]
MTVQTIPSIEEMTAAQRAELMEELWKAMSRTPEDVETPEWHRNVLRERERAFASGEIEYMDWEEAKSFIRKKTTERRK